MNTDVDRGPFASSGGVGPVRIDPARGMERRVSDLVNEAYGLTPEEVALMWETAPPRMPIAGPRSGTRGTD